MSGETEEYLKARRRDMSPQLAKLDEWLYDFTKEAQWRGVMALGWMMNEASANPKATFTEVLQRTKDHIVNFKDMQLSPDLHRLVHESLHRAMDELTADFLRHDPNRLTQQRRGLNSTIGELMTWSYRQTIQPEANTDGHN
jgi:hypothetical protein